MLFNKDRPGTAAKIWSKVITRIGITAVIIAGIVFLIIYLINKSGAALKEITENFESGKTVVEFRDYVTGIDSYQRLQVTTLNTVDIFTREDSRTILWDLIPLPDVKVEVKMPVEYSYYIDLKGEWQFRWNEKDSSVTVIAPGIKANTPAVDISNMSVTVQEGSFWRDEDAVKRKLIKELSYRLDEISVKKISLVRDKARMEVKKFVNNWFITFYFKDKKIKPEIKAVYFKDEVLPEQGEQFKLLQE